jgi:hypothetical protein
MKPSDDFNSRFERKELVLTIGYLMTAYPGRTTVTTVMDWLKNGLPNDLEERMEAAYALAKPIERVESELVAQGFLNGDDDALLNPNFSITAPITTLRDATDVRAVRAELMARVKKEFLDNVSSDLEGVERRLKEWISQVKMPRHKLYHTGLSNDGERLSFKLLHIGFSLEQQGRFDRGEDWPLWHELIAVIPEMAAARVMPNIDTGTPYRYLRRAPK